jgi:CheY-like chemotaxis protein
VIVSVRDSGTGIPPEALRRIFEMFSQVDRNIERVSGGLGIGLALVKGLVEMHGGTVSVMSEGDGKGSTFTVELPVAGANVDAVAPDPLIAVEIAPVRILVVDDNRDSAASLAMLLSLSGHDVHQAHDGEEAVARAEELLPDVILMDIGMPKLNGYAATQRIREHEWSKDMFIVALTGWGQSADREHSRNAGCNSHLVKPVSLEALDALLAERQSEYANRESLIPDR